MAIADQVITTIIDAVAALNTRVDDLSAQKAIPGPQGEPGAQGERGDDGRSPTDEEIKLAAATWLSANITQPSDGEQGPQGETGERGPAPTEDEIALAVAIWFEANAERLRGPRGERGPVGDTGADGLNGRDGLRGPAGSDGANGADGTGIALIEQRDEKSFWITLTDGREFEIELPVGKGGGSFFYSPPQPQLGAFYSLEDQTDGINNATPMRYEVTQISKGVFIEDLTKITVKEAGTYNIQFSAQFINLNSSEHEGSVWLSMNGSNVAATCTDFTVPSKHGNFNGHTVASWNFFVEAQRNDYFELYWSSPSSLLRIDYTPARTTPVRPAIPSVILTVNRVDPI